jgi:glycogen phosphorylase
VSPPTGLDELRGERPIAYFSMEIALRAEMPTYSGGLGVLAGDLVRTAADLCLPFVAVTQLSRRGYFRQTLDADGNQHEQPVSWQPERYLQRLPVRVPVALGGRDVLVQAWMCECPSPVGHGVPVLFLDTNLAENHADDRTITDELYGGDLRRRLEQEAILGIGGVRVLRALEILPRKYHANEGHSVLLGLELLRQIEGATFEERMVRLRELCVFTTHTPVEAGHDKFAHALVREVLGDSVPWDALVRLGGEGQLNMTLFGLNCSGYVNGVAERHRDVSAAMFPSHRISAITNGVHSHTWTAEPFRRLYDRYLPGWGAEPLLLARVESIPDGEIWSAHLEAKRTLLAHVHTAAGVELDPGALTVGFARRFTPYKRPALLFSDLDRLRRVARSGPMQVIFAGKAHPHDEPGKKLIKDTLRLGRQLERDGIRVVFLQDYGLDTAAKLVAGCDVWLNTPQPPLEASGTSGMKAAHNGVLNFSVLDGWWIEGHREGYTGWSIGPPPDERIAPDERRRREIDDLYGKLEFVVLPTFHRRQDEWVRMMKQSIDDLASYFNTHRMLRRYVTDAYFPRR